MATKRKAAPRRAPASRATDATVKAVAAAVADAEPGELTDAVAELAGVSVEQAAKALGEPAPRRRVREPLPPRPVWEGGETRSEYFVRLRAWEAARAELDQR